MSTRTKRTVVNGGVLIAAAAFLLALNSLAVERRSLPPRTSGTAVLRAGTQAEVYSVLRAHKVRGAHIIHFNRFFNLVAYLPEDDRISRPFPIPVFDMRPFYEKGLDAHNWLSIAARTGVVRKITAVLPDPVFRARFAELVAEPALTASAYGFAGYERDAPREVVTLRSLRHEDEPVIVTVDAGYFGEETDPAELAQALREKFPDVRLIVLVESRDEPGVTEGMRADLSQFGRAWKGGE